MNTNRTQRQAKRKRKLINRQRRIQYRLRARHWTDQAKPMFAASNIHYELADRLRARQRPQENCNRLENTHFILYSGT